MGVFSKTKSPSQAEPATGVGISLATAAVIVSATAEDDKQSDYNEPNALVVKNIAKAVVHSILQNICAGYRM